MPTEICGNRNVGSTFSLEELDHKDIVFIDHRDILVGKDPVKQREALLVGLLDRVDTLIAELVVGSTGLMRVIFFFSISSGVIPAPKTTGFLVLEEMYFRTVLRSA